MAEEAKQVDVPVELIAGRIRVVRGQRVLLDSDLAELFGVETRVFNQAVKRNAARFPSDFLLTLTDQEVGILRSQNVISSAGHGGRRTAPHAFTEHGAIMAATILNSPKAVEVSVYVVRAFVRMREVLNGHRDLAVRVGELESAVGAHDSAIRGIFNTLGQLKAPVSSK